MRMIDNWMTVPLRLAIVLGALGFSACSVLPGPQSPPDVPEPVEPAAEIPVLPPPSPPAPAPQKAVVASPAKPSRAALSIVLTSGAAAYTDVARELAGRFENHRVYNLSEEDRPPLSIVRSINDSDAGVIVAIGHRAATSSIAVSNKPVVFSQVFNYQQLLTDNSRGVSSIAPLKAQISAWKELDPSLSRIGTIVGPGHDALLAEAKIAAEDNGVDLIAKVAASDQETLFLFKRMIRNIDGFWLLPDNRILSPRALRQIVAGANRQQVPVLVPTESMLDIGADVSISTVASNIAENIAHIVRRIEAGELQDVPPMSPLSEIRVVVNDRSKALQR